MNIVNNSQYMGTQEGSPSLITVKGPCSVNPTWILLQNANVVASDGFALTLSSSEELVVSSYPENQYARVYQQDGSYSDVSQLQDFALSNFVTIPEGNSVLLFTVDKNTKVEMTFREERLLV
ncbi:hypothetical protein C0V80_04980 [Leuconostoc pseudomesenteroides]|nr:hypothetical protein [Leuconostoc pseudomesenteroides]